MAGFAAWRRAPAFWDQPPGSWPSRLLAPLGLLYAASVRQRLRRPGWRAPVPVICIGNAHVGGVGKTPVTLWLAEMLRALGAQPAVILRGYGGRSRQPTRVTADQDAAAVGDEALLYRRLLPTYVGRDRAALARLAVADGADLLLWDDGLQNPALVKDLTLLVYDAARGLGNGQLFPAGPLREPFAAALARSDLVIALGQGPALVAQELKAQLRLDPAALPAGPVAAFAGIGRPEKFRASLQAAGVTVSYWREFADHQPVPPAALTHLAASGLPLLCTEKDWVRLPPDWQPRVTAVPLQLDWLPEAAVRLLEQVALVRDRFADSGATLP